MQDYIMFNGIKTVQPDEDGYSANLSTTSTEDSDRDMALVMHNTPIATVESYSLKYSDIKAADAALILSQVLNKPSFTLHYFDILTASWRDGEFYATTFNSPCRTIENGVETWDELSFNVIGVNPR